jgi:hypothetical protein
MFRRTSTILGSATKLDATTAARLWALDADIIMTAVVLGLSAGHLAKAHPMTFHATPGPELEKLEVAVALLNTALGERYRFQGEVNAAASPQWQRGARTTGADPRTRLRSPIARVARAIAARDPDLGYQGWGAYTGFVDDPVNDRAGITATVRLNVEEAWGERWLPPRFCNVEDGREIGNQDTLPWGLITGKPELTGGIVQQRFNGGGLVGYTHGMVQAIYDCVRTGPWCTPFEIAVDDLTTRLASCLPCGLLMYAAGYPPTALHLGRGESWLPLQPKQPDDDGYSRPVDEAIRSTNERWYRQCEQHLNLGVTILAGASVADRPGARLPLLVDALKREEPAVAANLILDAVTVPGPEVDRILRTLSGSG